MKVTIDEIVEELRGECNGCKRVMLAERIESHGIERPSGELSFDELAEQMIGWINRNGNPHTYILADSISAQLLQGKEGVFSRMGLNEPELPKLMGSLK